ARRVQREAYGEYRAAARVVARVDVTAMQARVLPGDRQAQAAPLGTRPRRVGLVEPVEYMRDRGGGPPVAAGSDFPGPLPPARRPWHLAGCRPSRSPAGRHDAMRCRRG